jgi:MYND finger
MRLGATIEPKYMAMLREAYLKIRVAPKYSWPLSDTGFRAPMKEQFEIALNHYQNDGTPYDFYAERCKGPGCNKAKEELEEGVNLKLCAKCKLVSYCGKECQKAHWPKHKKQCKTPEKRAEEEKAQVGNRGFMSLNV